MKVLITGATGAAGSGALQAALDEPRVDQVVAVTRRPLSFTHPKLTVVEKKEQTDWSSFSFSGVDAVLWCLGISTSEVSKEEYQRITYDAAISAAQKLWQEQPQARFCFLSGRGTDSTEKSLILFARVKGRTENALLKMNEAAVFCFRPGYIHPTTKPASFGRGLVFSLAPVLRKLQPQGMIDAPVLGRAMVKVALDGAPQKILENGQLLSL